jgi:hypothetical protein
MPEAVLNYLARLGWSHGDAEVFTKEQFVEWFNLDHLGKSPAQHNPEKLLWLNHQYIQQADAADLAKRALPFVEKLGIKSGTISEKGSKSSITFVANKNDTYYCTVPGHRAAGMVGKLEVVEGEIIEKIVVGKLPMKNGKPLNLNFESGDLRDWTATGDAFTSPLINADPSPIHDKDMTIGFKGKTSLVLVELSIIN